MQHWKDKFKFAIRGVAFGVQGQSSFLVHVLAGIAVVGLATWLGCEPWQWCVLLLCIGLVFSAELANSSIESLARGLCHEQNEQVGRALDIASGAVLIASLFASAIGLMILGPKLFWALGFL